MAVTFTPGTDFYDVVDGTETVTLESVAGSDSFIALRREIGYMNSAGVEIAETVFHVSVDDRATQIEKGATFKDAIGRQFVVLDSKLQTLSRRWRCRCRSLLTDSESLDTWVDLYVGTFTKGAGGAAEPTFAKSQDQAIRARIDGLVETPAVEHDLQMTSQQGRITLARDVSPEIGRQYRFVEIGVESVSYKILSYTRGTDEALPFASVVKAPWPYA